MTNAPEHTPAEAGTASSTLTRFADGTAVIAFVTAATYMVGFSYFDAFFTRLSVPRHSIALGTMEYMYIAFFIFLAAAVAVVPAAFVAAKRPDSIVTAVVGNLPWFAFVGILAVSGVRNREWLLLSMALLAGFLSVLISLKRASLAYFIYSSPGPLRFASLGGIALLGMVTGSLLGDVHAEKLIDGSLRGASLVKFQDKSGQPLFQGEEFALVLIDNTNYYVVRRQTPAPLRPELLVVRREEVAVATIRRTQ